MNQHSLTEEQLSDITSAIIAGRKIQAIKEYRKATGLDLKDSKKAIEEITESLSEEYPELKKANAAGCASIILIGFCVSSYATYEAFLLLTQS